MAKAPNVYYLCTAQIKGAVQGGYPRFELERNPELDGLRKDPRYREIMAEAPKPR
jgi:hypothetical protein